MSEKKATGTRRVTDGFACAALPSRTLAVRARGRVAPAEAAVRGAWPDVQGVTAIALAPPPPGRRRAGPRWRQSPWTRGREPTALRERSEATDEPHDLAEDPQVFFALPDDDGRHGRMLRTKEDGVSVTGESLDGRLAVYQGHNAVAGLGMTLATHEHEVALDDVGVDHALPADPETEDVVPSPADPGRIERERAIPILLGEKRRARGDAPEYGHLV